MIPRGGGHRAPSWHGRRDLSGPTDTPPAFCDQTRSSTISCLRRSFSTGEYHEPDGSLYEIRAAGR
jgi:hypothetical protein